MATVTKGKTFISGETVEPADMHQLVDSATVTNIVDADISASAAIAGTKIAPNFGSQNVVTTGAFSCRAATFITGSPDRIGTDFTSNAISTLNFGSANSGDGNFQLQYNRSAGTFAILGGQTGSQTERMRIDASGNVGIGTSSPAYRLAVTDGSVATRIHVVNTNNASAGAGIYLQVSSGGSTVSDCTVSANNAGSLIFSTGTTSGAARVQIKSTGQVRFIPLAADPAGAEAGDVYYNSSSNKLKVYNGTSWVDLH